MGEHKILNSLSQTEGQISFVCRFDIQGSSIFLSAEAKSLLKLESNHILFDQFCQLIHPDDRFFYQSLRTLELSIFSEIEIDQNTSLKYCFRLLIAGVPRLVCCTDKANKNNNPRTFCSITSVLQDIAFLDFTGRLSFYWSSTSISFLEFKRRLKQKMRFNLTNQEIKIIRMIKGGCSYSEISERLFISTSTVKKHLNNIYTKCNCKNSRELLNYSEKYYTLIFS